MFYIHSEKTYIRSEKTYTEWIPQLIDSQIHWLILSLLAFEASKSFQECSIWNYWSHGCKMCITLSYKFWKVFVMACRHSIFAFKDYFKSFVWLLEVVGQKPCIRDISRRLIFHLCVLFGLWTKMTTQWCQILMNMGEEQQFNGLLDVYKKTFATNSIAGLYRGFFLVTCAGNIVCCACK